MNFYRNLQKRMFELFRVGFTKRELISRIDENIYLLIENDKDSPATFQVLLMDEREDAGNGKEYLTIGKNLDEVEAMELAVDFARYCRLF